MATTSMSSMYASLLYLCLLFCLEKGAYAFEGRKIAESNNLHTIQVSDLLPSTACKHSTKVAENKAAFKVVHRHGPCSQLIQDNANAPNLENILVEDQSRVDSIHSKFSRTSRDSSYVKQTDATRLPANRGVSLGTGNYIVTVGLGTPRKDLPLIFDTGSDLTWARCMPGVDAFDPTRSSSYHNISCKSEICSYVTSATGYRPGCASTTCEYGVRYGDGSFTYGFVGNERLSIGSADVFDNITFGCSQRSEGLFGKVGGLMGLGRAKLSIISQTDSKYKKLFSYCLPVSGKAGFLSFGASQSKSAKFIPLSSNSDFYSLDLAGIVVGNRRLSIPASVFSKAGTIIDSGTVITRLQPKAYSALRSAFTEAMSKYPKAEPLSILDTCYDFSKYKTIEVPKIALSFNVGDVEIDQSGIFFANGISQVCLAFAGNTDARDIAIFGNMQQQNYEVVYDVNGGKIGFAPGACS
ncbi:hypothetical protein GH714_008890 [Hevea brasiliensis]|uniref:Peptidase A1 domain-containing protein n=1 Tax=Hevea brasiliensis TaxID=3981 RepID=A0A6A6ML10_HEVBR|nr:hypothetical protein GH714_008890 [Hevea brasiliensis]